MKKIIAFICLVCINIPVISSECGSIVKRGFIYYCGETKLTKANDIRSALSECPAACDQFETGYNLGIGGSIFVGIGGGCIGYNLGRMIGSGGKETAIRPLWAIGGGCFGVGLIFASVASQQKKYAITKFNNRICNALQSNQKINIRLSFNSMWLTVDL